MDKKVYNYFALLSSNIRIELRMILECKSYTKAQQW